MPGMSFWVRVMTRKIKFEQDGERFYLREGDRIMLKSFDPLSMIGDWETQDGRKFKGYLSMMEHVSRLVPE